MSKTRPRWRTGKAGLTLGAVLILGGMASFEAPVADAAMRGDIEAVRSLLRSGADVNAAQGDGMTALHWAARLGQRELAEVRRKNLRFREVTGPVCAVCGLATVCSLLYGPSSVVRYRIYHICNTFQRGRSYHHRV